LHSAAKLEKGDIVEILLHHGANINEKDVRGKKTTTYWREMMLGGKDDS
jgi:hypothetical protein